MNCLQLLGMKPPDVYSGTSKKEKLFIELGKISSSFMIHICVADEMGLKPFFLYSYAKFKIFAHACNYITACGRINFF